MSPRRTDARERMLESAVSLIAERGVSGTSVDEVLAVSGAPRGSVYHHFPGGRAQLVQEAVELAGTSIGDLVRGAGDADPAAVFDAFLASWREALRASDYRAGCPVLAVAIESRDGTTTLVDTARATFDEWREALGEMLRRGGASPARARRLATLVVAAVEGAVVLSRAERTLKPLDEVGRELRGLLISATD